MNDIVNHPEHYTQGGVECIDAIAAATTGLQGIEAVCTANVIKYIWRWKRKNGVEDIKKALWYLNKLKSVVENPEPTIDNRPVIWIHATKDGVEVRRLDGKEFLSDE